jgi:hypothetical protein
MQYIKSKFGWMFEAMGPEVQADTLYWNNGEFCDDQRTSSSNANRHDRSGLLSLMGRVFASEMRRRWFGNAVYTYMKRLGRRPTRIGETSSILLTEAFKVAVQMRIALSQGRAKQRYKSQRQRKSDNGPDGSSQNNDSKE